MTIQTQLNYLFKKILTGTREPSFKSTQETLTNCITESIDEYRAKESSGEFKAPTLPWGLINDNHFQNPPYWDALYQFHYTLKENSTPSAAMTNLLTSDSNAEFLCQSRQKVIMYRAIQKFLIECHGDEDGNYYFNQLFQRLTLSEVSLSNSLPFIVDNDIINTPLLRQFSSELDKRQDKTPFTVNPLVFFYTQQPYFDKQSFESKSGDLPVFWNHPMYKTWNPTGFSRFQATVAVGHNQYSLQYSNAPSTIAEVYKSLVDDCNKKSNHITLSDLPIRIESNHLKPDLIQQLAECPNDVVRQLQEWEAQMNELFEAIHNAKISRDTTQKNFTTMLTKLKTNYNRDHLKASEQIGIAFITNKMQNYRIELMENQRITKELEQTHLEITVNLLNMATCYRISGQLIKSDFFYSLADKMMADNNPFPETAKSQKKRLTFFNQLKEFTAIINTPIFNKLLHIIYLTQFESSEAAIDDIFNTAQMKPFLRKNTEILNQMNDICQQFEPSETEKLNLEDFTRLTFKALQPFIEYYLGIEETTYQQIITDNSNPLTQSIEQMVTMVFKEATNIEPK
ncbi:MAG: hypothetical protein VXX85_06210 [Candidatus Margulisiibacteriota bacterium]|nr:hypothetical protein [Candidatus Margulisiibacteriota bacterium]